MDWAFVVVLQIMLQPSLSVLFTVEAERTTYTSEFGGDVVMGCRFQPKPADPHAEMRVTWHWITTKESQEVYQLDNGVEHVALKYQGRVKLLSNELKEGWAKLQVSSLRISDSGTYQCLVHTGEGADYKTMALSVIAPYKTVAKHIEKTSDGNEVLLTCQSEGYPRSSVVWKDGHLQMLNDTTTTVQRADQLFLITSQIHASSSDINNYTCNFTNDDLSATFHIPDELPTAHIKNDALIVILSIGVVMAVIIIAVLMYRRQKGSSAPSTRNLLMDNDSLPAPYLKIKKENDEEKIILKEEHTEEDLGVFLKAQYCDMFLSTEVRRLCSNFDVENLHHRLQNNEGQPANLQALLPEAGETVFLEGPPGSGKTTIAYTLVCSWTEGHTHALSNLLDLSILQLLLYVDCSTNKGDLFHEIMAQLSLKERISTQDELRTALTRSSKALLLLDGYREGNQIFDESLKRFLSERGGCRVLLMACPDHCPMLKDTVGTFGELKLQTRTVKY